jgi:hypothetical protein
MATGEGFPELRVTRPPYGGNPVAGVPGCEGMVVPCGYDANQRLATFRGRLDTLYFYQSNCMLEVMPPCHSWMDHAAFCLRYSGPDQGPLIMQGAPLFFLPEDQVVGTFEAGLRWLLDH